MKRLMLSLVMMVTMLVSTAAHAEAQLGKDYTLLNPPQPASTKKIDVIEFFFYECPHCFHLHPYLDKWEKTKGADVDINFVPTIFRASTEPLAHAYYALQGMGKINKLDDAIYQAIHVQNIGLYDETSISNFVAQHGINKAEFESAYNSFSVQSKVARAKQLIRDYNIEGTPTLVVDGKYVITGMESQDLIKALNLVVDKVRKDRAMANRH